VTATANDHADMRSVVAEPAFTYDGHEYLVGDVVLVAIRSGVWLWLEARTRASCAAQRAFAERGDAVDGEMLRNVAALFRHERGLFSGEDLREWLAARRLTPDAWRSWLERSVLASTQMDGSDEGAGSHSPSNDELAAALRVDALCTGVLKSAAELLLAHAAAARAEGGDSAQVGEPDVATQAATALGNPLLGLDTLPTPDLESRLRHLAGLQAAADRFTNSLASSEALDRLLVAHRLDWAMLGWHELTFPKEGAAREVAMLVRQDGMTFDDVAAMLAVSPTGRAASLDQTEPELQPLLASAAPDDLLGPVETEAGWRLLYIRERKLPARTDAAAFTRALEELRSKAIDRQLAGRVRWHVDL
jgi:hypothetical protein